MKLLTLSSVFAACAVFALASHVMVFTEYNFEGVSQRITFHARKCTKFSSTPIKSLQLAEGYACTIYESALCDEAGEYLTEDAKEIDLQAVGFICEPNL